MRSKAHENKALIEPYFFYLYFNSHNVIYDSHNSKFKIKRIQKKEFAMDQQVNTMFHQDRLMQHLGAHLVSFGAHSLN